VAQRVVVRKKAAPKVDMEQFMETFRTWALHKGAEEYEKLKKERLKKDALFPVLEAVGEKDDKGSFIITFPESMTISTRNVDDVKKSTVYTGLKKQRNATQVFLQDKAQAWLEKNNLLGYCVVTTTVSTWTYDFATDKRVLEKEESTHLDQDAVYVLNQQGKIPDRTLNSFFGENVVWSIVPVKA
jgi:hypothetical protein